MGRLNKRQECPTAVQHKGKLVPALRGTLQKGMCCPKFAKRVELNMVQKVSRAIVQIHRLMIRSNEL